MTEPGTPLSIILRVTHGPCQGASVALRGMQAVLGRDADCALCLDSDSTVSRRHASLSWERGQWLLRDLGSKNGTFIQTPGGAVRLEAAHALAPGDTFLAGSAAISVQTAPRPLNPPP